MNYTPDTCMTKFTVEQVNRMRCSIINYRADLVDIETGGNVPPSAGFTSSANALAVTFTDQSTDSDGTIAARAWTFGDGGTSTATSPSHTYAAAGTYTVTFTLTGFNTSRREGVQVSPGFTATIDGDMRLGNIQETVTVTAESPMVDVQSAALRRAVTADEFKELPSGGSWIQMAALTSAVKASNQDVGGILGDQTGAQVTVPGTETSAVVPGLTSGSSYTFTVQATNGAGTGPSSLESAAVIPFALPPETVITSGPATGIFLTTGEATFGEIIDDLAKTFNAPRERIHADVTALLRGLADKRLLEL